MTFKPGVRGLQLVTERLIHVLVAERVGGKGEGKLLREDEE